MQEQMYEQARQSAWCGAEFLDRQVPGWWQQVDPGQLRIASAFHCVLGQLYGTFLEGVWELRLTCDDSRRYGFVSRYSLVPAGQPTDEPLLTQAWCELIAARRAAAATAASEALTAGR